MKNFFNIILVLGLWMTPCAGEELMPRTTVHMQKAEFWVSRHPNPDEVILTRDEIGGFNRRLFQRGITTDLTADFTDRITDFKRLNEIEWQKFRHGRYYDLKGEKAPPEFFLEIKDNLNLSKPAQLATRYAVTTTMTNQRLLPTDAILTAEPKDLEFDEVQNSSLDMGTPVVVLWESHDGKWGYALTAASGGWIRIRDLGFLDRTAFETLLKTSTLVVTSAQAAVYLDPQRARFNDVMRMGSRLSFDKDYDRDLWCVRVPRRDKDGQAYFVPGYVYKENAGQGFLPYTPRTIIQQAFKLLDASYGWGGIDGKMDCSAFIKAVFATVGIDLPRNSGEQGQVGHLRATLAESMPGITVAQLKGHIVLYLGEVNGQPYAIHEAYAYREPGHGQDRVHVVNRVIVSDFLIGAGTKKGSLLERIKAVREIR